MQTMLYLFYFILAMLTIIITLVVDVLKGVDSTLALSTTYFNPFHKSNGSDQVPRFKDKILSGASWGFVYAITK